MMTELNWLEILRSSFTLIILIGCSILSLAFAVERWIYFKRNVIDHEGFLSQLKKMLEGGQMKEAASLCERTPGPVAAVAKTAVVNHSKSKESLTDLLEAVRIDKKIEMERFLVILGTLGNASPFIGLFGTVVGIIKAFRDLALSGTGGPAVVAKGIAEALVATAAGLAVAIPAVIFYNYYQRKVKATTAAMESASLRVMDYLR